jgi:hypothetical protein
MAGFIIGRRLQVLAAAATVVVLTLNVVLLLQNFAS